MPAAIVDTPTGLAPATIRGLKREERVRLAAWQEHKSGDNNGRLWLPAAIRFLPVEARLHLAGSDQADAAWVERERRRVESPHYFIRNYGHVQDEDGGAPIPFELWKEQGETLDTFLEELLIVVLKARQLGLTWLALHYGYHLMAFHPATPNAVVLGLSQDGGYAKRLLDRARRINELLPPYLRHLEDRGTRESKTEFKLAGRGKMASLAGTKDAPRSYQADLAICDEWAFVRNGQAGPTTTALLPAARQVIAISSGNGPPEEPGWGQYFARLYTNAAAGESDWTPVFLPTSTHPSRTKAWREREQDNYDTEEEYLAEHPETDDEALIGAGRDRYFKLAEINAAVKAGSELDELLGSEDMPPPAGELVHLGLDWGEASQAYAIWPLEGGGFYVPPSEIVETGTEPGETCAHVHDKLLAELQEVDPSTGRLAPAIGEARYDAAGIQSMRTFLAVARRSYSRQYAHGEVRSRKVPFGKYKRETAQYMRRLFRRVGQGRTTGIVAISPANEVLVRQLRSLESGPDGVWKKDDDQHGPDAVVAGAQRIARRHRQAQATDDDVDEG